jgi:CRISPR/Cas system CSM-associated protein Csm2 small subunit
MEAQHKPILEDWMIDQRIEEVKSRTEEIERLKEITNQRIQDIQAKADAEIQKLVNQNEYDLRTIGEAVRQHKNKKQSKTMESVKFVSGKASIKFAQKKFKPIKELDDSKLIELFPDFIEEETKIKLKWGDLKGTLKLVGDRVISEETGEDLTEYFTIEEKPEEVVIK